MADEPVMLYLPPGVEDAQSVLTNLNHVFGWNVRVEAHDMWHATNDEMHPTERTVRFAQIQCLLDYADKIDPVGHEITEHLKREFGWALS